MRVALNILYLIPGVVGGTQTYAVELIRALARLDTENEYLIYMNREAAELELTDAPNFRRVVCPIHAIRRPVRYAWEQAALPHQLRLRRIHVLHSLGYVGPLASPCRHVVTIHDLNYLHHENKIGGAKRNLLAKLIPRVARAADHLLTVSEFSKREMVEHIGVPAEKITVTHEGQREYIPETPQLRAEVERRYPVARPYLAAFSSPSPHKNISRLLEAFAQIRAEVPHDLLLIGHLPEGRDLRAEITRLGLDDRIALTGYVPDEHVMPLLARAALFVFPSLYEGFGLPLLDAQRAGVPVACSTAASLPEVAGSGAVKFDPCSVSEMAQVIRMVLTDPLLQASLRERGRTNLARFAWERAARETRAVYESLFSPRHY